MVGCPVRCSYCPQDKLRGEYGKRTKYLSPTDFEVILAKVPRHVRIDFSGMAEPWANPDATKMLRYALKNGRTVAIYTTLYGMTREDCPEVIRLLRAYADQIEILSLHLPDKNGNMRGWKYTPEYEANLRDFAALISGKVLKAVEIMTMDGNGEVHADLAHMGIQLHEWMGHGRAGNVDGSVAQGQPFQTPVRHATAVSCSFTPFYDQNVVLPNGDVVLCCMDYGLKHTIGNLLEQSYYEMFASDGVAKVVAENMRPGFSFASLCKTCNRATAHRQTDGTQLWRTT